jgi:polyketide cyclase/dehydrase/lipid transport protein
MSYGVVVEKTVPVSRQRFFAELMDFGGVAKLSPDAVDKVECEGEGIGAVRTVHIKGLPGAVIERLDVASGERVFAYSIINETALPLTRYCAVVELADAPGGGCLVRWGSNWIAKDRPESDVQKMLTQLYTTLIEGIVRVATG